MNVLVIGRVNVVVATPDDMILVVRNAHGERWSLPETEINLKFGVDQLETPVSSLVRSIGEQTGLWPKKECARLAALLWAPRGLVMLYNILWHFGPGGDRLTRREGLESRFMSLSEIFQADREFNLNHKRMIAVWQRQRHTSRIYEGYLSDEVAIVVDNKTLRI